LLVHVLSQRHVRLIQVLLVLVATRLALLLLLFVFIVFHRG
jgi:hypothetical protein